MLYRSITQAIAFHILICSRFEQKMAKEQGLWNLFLPAVSGLNQTEYALIAEETGRFFIAPECLNCSAPGKKRKVTLGS
jgi:hypothetical protein